MFQSLDQLYFAEKRLATGINWTVYDRDIRARVPLSINDVLLEELTLIMRTPRWRVDEDVHFMLRGGIPGRAAQLLERICWRPSSSHNNRGNGPNEFKFVDLNGSHCHAFEQNYDAVENKMCGKLRIAVPIEIDSYSFQKAFAYALERFNIKNGGGDCPEPPWEMNLFDD